MVKAAVFRNNKIDTVEKENQQPKTQPLYYLIVELDQKRKHSSSGSNGGGGGGLRSQYMLVNSTSICAPVVNLDSIYTGKKVQIKDTAASGPQRGTCVLISNDLKFVQEQLHQITNNMDQHGANGGGVLNNSLKMHGNNNNNVLQQANNNNTNTNSAVNAKEERKKVFKFPRTSAAAAAAAAVANKENQKGDNDNDEQQQQHAMDFQVESNKKQKDKPMTFDQQSQTDLKLHNEVLPATAAQIHQQSSQIAQLIRAKNCIYTEVKQIRQSNTDLVAVVNQMAEKLEAMNQLLAQFQMVNNIGIGGGGGVGAVVTAPASSISDSNNQSMKEESGHEENNSMSRLMITDDDSIDMSMNGAVVAVEQQPETVYSIVEYTPPLKKNKVKLNESLNNSHSSHSGSRLSLNANFVAYEFDPKCKDSDYEIIGRNGTRVPKAVLKDINFASHSSATRKLMMACFDRPTLATHSLTGKPSPAFLDRDPKMKLNPFICQDIIDTVMAHTQCTETQVRSVITSKCADENKMSKLTAKKLGQANDSST